MKRSKADWSMVWGMLYVLLAWGALAFFDNANATTVRGYADMTAACADLALEADGGKPYGFRETHNSEIDFHVKSKLPYYTYNGNCYQANQSLQRLATYQETAQVTLLAAHPIAITSRVVLIKGALERYKKSVGAYLMGIYLQVVGEIFGIKGPVNYVVDVNEELTAQTWKDPCGVLNWQLSLQAPGATHSRLVSDCRKIVPRHSELQPSERIPVSCPSDQTDLSTCDQTIIQLAEDYEISDDSIENLAKQGKSCAEIESTISEWVAELIEADAGPLGPQPRPWPGNWPSDKPKKPRGD